MADCSECGLAKGHKLWCVSGNVAAARRQEPKVYTQADVDALHANAGKLRAERDQWKEDYELCQAALDARRKIGEEDGSDLLRRIEKFRVALVKIAELEGDSENQNFKLTRFQAAQVARQALHCSCCLS